MKKLLLIAGIAGLIYYWYTREDDTPKGLVERPMIVRSKEPDPAPKVAEPPPQMPAAKVSAPPSPTPNGEPNIPKGTVPFRRVGDWVVAYGDILLGKPTEPDFPENGVIEAPKIRLWKGEIPFSIHQDMINPERIMRVIEYFNENTPVKFVPLQDQKDGIVFAPMDGHCLSYVGKIGGFQPIYLDDRCGEQEIKHEIMHALGFVHEHSRPDRDAYVAINWENILEERRDQFTRVPENLAEPLKGRPFDYNSVMLYPTNAFAKDRGGWTIQSRTGQPIEPSPQGLSHEDLERLRLLVR